MIILIVAGKIVVTFARETVASVTRLELQCVMNGLVNK